MAAAAGLPVLVVDDDPDIRAVIEEILIEEGYAVRTAGDGAEALEQVAREHPLVILLDMRMPGMDGWTFARVYRQRPGPHAPIVVCTAAKDARDRAAEIDAFDALAKPFRYAELTAVVGRAATSHRSPG